MITATQLHEIAKTIVAQNYDYDYIGLRIQESDYGLTVGQQITHNSHHWDDGEMLADEIDGICAVDASLAAQHVLSFGGYIGNTILVLGSNSADSGEDDGEVILKSTYGNPTILDIIRC